MSDETVDRAEDPDQALIAALQADLLHGTGERTGAMFAAEGLMAPLHLWSPSRHDLHHPLHQNLAQAIAQIMRDDGSVYLREFVTLGLDRPGDWLIVVERDGDDFRYLQYGRNISGTFGLDMTGRRVLDITTFIAPFFQATYAAVWARNKWLLTVHEAPQGMFARAWRRLMVPLLADDGTVAQIATLNVADNDLREGLEVLPDAVIITTPGGQVVFANLAARNRFGEPGPVANPSSLEAYIGAPVQLPDAGADLDHYNPPDTEVSAVIDGILIHFFLSARRISYRGQSYIAVSLRQT